MNLATTLAGVSFGLLLASALVQAFLLFRRPAAPERLASILVAAAASVLLVVLALRSVELRFIALTNTYESLAFYAAAVGFVAVWYRFQRRLPYQPVVVFGATMIALVLLAIANSPLVPDDVLPPIPALRSAWLLLHVSFSFIGEAFFAAGFVTAIAYLCTIDPARRLELDRLTYTAVAVGYPFFTAGALVFGAIWAERAWGRWWSWDPKETWALVTWLVYTTYLHVRLIAKRKESLPALVSVLGFLCTIFTFFGVNYLLPGLHSY
ncbi:MAG: cytochrome c biogenesis protein CcsA [Spirochaetales bacterium]|nr:cytochrome c biogenesis protein CcsA [Spirochaetales bacterium]